MSAPLPEAKRAVILAQLGDAQPASDGLLESFASSVYQREHHEHPRWEDFFCLNLSSYMGERVAPVLRRLVDAEARVAELEQQLAAAKADGYQRAIEVMRAERLPMSVGLLEAQAELDALDAAVGGERP